MSRLLNASGLGKEEVSDSPDLAGAATQDHSECSLSRCDSSSSVITDAMQAESKTFENSTSSETAWTDSKHSSYLDFMEANFVQNMFARCYCMEDVCGGTAHNHYHQRHHQQQRQSDTKYVEENEYDSAQSELHSHVTLEYIHDEPDWRSRPAARSRLAARSKAPTSISTSLLLANPWVKHYRRKGPSSVRSKISTLPSNGTDKIGRTKHKMEIVDPIVDEDEQRSNSISASEEPMKAVGTVGKILELEAGQIKDHILSQNDMASKRVSKNKRRILWSTYKEVHRVRRKTKNFVQHGITVIRDDVAAQNLTLDPVMEGDLVL